MKGGGQVRGPTPPEVVRVTAPTPLHKLSDEDVRLAVEPQNITGRISLESKSSCHKGPVKDYEDHATYIPVNLILNDRFVKEHVKRWGESGHEMEFLFGKTPLKAGVAKGGIFKGWILHKVRGKLCVMGMSLEGRSGKVSLAEYESKKAPTAPKARVVAGPSKGVPTARASKKHGRFPKIK